MDRQKIIPDMLKGDPDLVKAWEAGWDAIYATTERGDYDPRHVVPDYYTNVVGKQALEYAKRPDAKKPVIIYMLAQPALDSLSLAGISREFGADAARIHSEVQNLTSLRFSNTLLGVDLSSVSPLTREMLQASRDRSLLGENFSAASAGGASTRAQSAAPAPLQVSAPRYLN
jgi:hypothetical protein